MRQGCTQDMDPCEDIDACIHTHTHHQMHPPTLSTCPLTLSTIIASVVVEGPLSFTLFRSSVLRLSARRLHVIVESGHSGPRRLRVMVSFHVVVVGAARLFTWGAARTSCGFEERIAEEQLRRHWGHTALRPFQREAPHVDHVASLRHRCDPMWYVWCVCVCVARFFHTIDDRLVFRQRCSWTRNRSSNHLGGRSPGTFGSMRIASQLCCNGSALGW